MLARRTAAMKQGFYAFIAVCLMFILQPAGRVHAADCGACHPAIMQRAFLHPALQIGCETCHPNLDASAVPHVFMPNSPKGLSAGMPELCYGCHDKKKFEGAPQSHAALKMGSCGQCHDPHGGKDRKMLLLDMPDLCFKCHDGKKFKGESQHQPSSIGLCTSCHEPHQAGFQKLLRKKSPDICFDCHSREAFSRKNVHAPVAGGMCMQCHKPHASSNPHLLTRRPVAVCNECHSTIKQGVHVITGVNRGSHPIGTVKKEKKPLKDLIRKNEEFYCGSCHNPHSSDWGKLFRYEAARPIDLCSYCHNL